MTGRSRLDDGRETLESIDPSAYEGLVALLEPMAPGLSTTITEFAFGDISRRTGLDLKTRELATVAAVASVGGLQPQLTSHLVYALRLGWTAVELTEALVQLAPVVGFPRVINGLLALQDARATVGENTP